MTAESILMGLVLVVWGLVVVGIWLWRVFDEIREDRAVEADIVS